MTCAVNKLVMTMAPYQIRNGKPSIGYYGHGHDSEDYQAMNIYFQVKNLKTIIRKVLQSKINPYYFP